MNKKIAIIFGTRPEAIKMAPIVWLLNKQKKYKVIIINTAQHREMLDPILKWFSLKADYDLNLMQKKQSLSELTAKALVKLEKVLIKEKPNLVLVQGDTTSAFVGALSSFYQKISIGYVESGLRTGDKLNPFPEEINRILISHLADLHFAPTVVSKNNLKKEGINTNKIFVTGNTVIDALLKTTKKYNKDFLIVNNKKINLNKKYILVTIHRRENLGLPMKEICLALKQLATKEKKDVNIIFPVHRNPAVRKVVFSVLKGVPNIFLTDPLDYPVFCNLMAKSSLILTDSGGIQEEAPSLGKNVLVLRHKTERPEALKSGMVRLVGLNKDRIIKEVETFFNYRKGYNRIKKIKYPFGNGKAAEKIVKHINSYLHLL